MLILAGGALLVIGAVLALALRANWARAAAAVASQAGATGLVLAAVLPVIARQTTIRAAWAWSFPIEVISVQVDPLSAFFLAWSLPMTLVGTLYAVGYLQPYFARGRNGGSHFALLNMISLSFLIIYTVGSALIFLLGWEIAAVSAWLLVIWDYRNQKIRFAGFNYLVSTHIGLFVLVAAFMILHSQTDSMDFGAFARFLGRASPLRNVVFVLLVTSFGLKSAFFPFHAWLPRAHSAAPAHVSALMSGVIHKAGLFGLLRFTLLMGTPEEWMGWYLILFSGLSALLGVLYTSGQRDLKRLLGYSSTENVGIAGLGIGVGYLGLAWHQPALVLLGFAGGALHILNHALFKCLLFYAVGAVYRAVHSVDLERLGGLARRLPRTACFFLLGGVAISALPPLNGFVSEYLIYSGLLSNGVPAGLSKTLLVCVAALLAFVGAVSALSMTRAFGLAFLGQPRDATIHVGEDAAPSMVMSMSLHAVGVVLLGLVPAAGLWLVRPVALLFLGLVPRSDAIALPDVGAFLGPVNHATWLLLLLVGVLVFLGPRARRSSAQHVTWGCGYTAPNPRMQYTGTSFSLQFTRVFETFLPQLRREKLPAGYFPEGHGHVGTHNVDAVERRMFEVLNEGESYIVRFAARIPEQPRFAFAAGLIVLAVMVALLFSGGTP
jgi:hydrogenase-4 component B